jgi:alpha-galactosidase
VSALAGLQDESGLWHTLLVGSLAASPSPRVRFRGLDPLRSYRLRPVLPGGAPSGLHSPVWFGVAPDGTGAVAGTVLSGAALEHVGVASPIFDPDQVVLIHAEAIPA